MELTGHLVMPVKQAGLAGVSNGKLLAKLQGHYDAFVTVDQNLPAQQNLVGCSFGTVVLRAKSNRIEDLMPLVAAILEALARLRPGTAITIEGE